MSAESNKQIIREIGRHVFVTGDLDALDELIAEDYLDHDPGLPPGLPPGRAGYKAMTAQLRAAFPDLEVSIEDQVAEGDKVVTRYVMRGTHHGELWGIPATGNRFELEGINIDRVADGRFCERWAAYDSGELMRQLGVAPAD
jgi:steroid delta-isomerase-like uncharacterized protein